MPRATGDENGASAAEYIPPGDGISYQLAAKSYAPSRHDRGISYRSTGVTVAIVSLVLLSGCNLAMPAEETPETSSPSTATSATDERGVDSLPPNVVQFDRRPEITLKTNESGFFYRGSVWSEMEEVDSTAFENVTLRVYSENWSVLASRDLGTFEAGTLNVSVDVQTTTVPKWLVVEHPDFREHDVYARVMVREGGQYVLAWRSDLDAPPLTNAGRCR